MSAAISAVKQALGLPADEVAALSLRLHDVDAELASTEAARANADTDLTESERKGETTSADSAATRLDLATAKLVRLAVRRAAVSGALNEAQSAKTAEEKITRIEAGNLALGKATARADAASSKLIATLVQLSGDLAEFSEALSVERQAASDLERDGETPRIPARYFSQIEEAAAKRVGVHSTLEIRCPVK